MIVSLYLRKINIISAVLILLITFSAFSQNSNTEHYQYIYPLPGSRDINPENNIIIRWGEVIDHSSISNNFINVVGSKSGNHKGSLILSDDSKTIVFLPDKIFELDEEVNVKLSAGIRTLNGQGLPSIHYNFFVKKELPDKDQLNNLNQLLKTEDGLTFTPEKYKHNSSALITYPEKILNTSNNPTPGNIFLTLLYPNQDSYLMIMCNDGIPIYYNRLPWASRNLLLQPDGSLTYYDHSRGKFFQMDSSYNVVDSFYCRNGFEETTQFHEFILLANGHSFMMARDNRVVRMDTIVVGGDSAAVVSGFVIQELDANDNVIFQWNTFDHFEITDATPDVNLLANSINPFHCNSLAIDDDGNLLLSSRYLDEITKINRQTGEIIWRFGGVESANNEFTFINDMRTFSHQHCARRLPNGNLILFDNGNLFTPQYSRASEYEMDEINKIATLVWNFANTPQSFTGAAGSVQRFSDENTLVGWGVPQGVSSGLTETDYNGNVTLDFSYPENYTSYRAFKYSWKTNLFSTDPDSIFFESISVGDSASINFLVKNNSSQQIEITNLFNKDSQFSIEHSLPFIIQPFQSELMQVKFKPTSEGFFKDELHIRSQTDTSRIAQILFLSGRTDSSFSSVEIDITTLEFRLEQNYPNPFNPSTKIKFTIPTVIASGAKQSQYVTLKIYDILGNEVATLVNEELPVGEYEVEFSSESSIENPASGIYFYQLKARGVIQTKKMLLLK